MIGTPRYNRHFANLCNREDGSNDGKQWVQMGLRQKRIIF